jgi:DNA-binding transcriptional ArsR family regulator
MRIGANLHVGGGQVASSEAAESRLDAVFFVLSDPTRRSILQQLDGHALLVSELAAPFDISLQAVWRHIQVLVRAGLIQQERSGRISRCSLDAGPLLDAAVWINRYSKYWGKQFNMLASTFATMEARALDRPASQAAGMRPGKGARRRK